MSRSFPVMKLSCSCVLALLFAAIVTTVSDAADWVQWRGPQRDCRLTEQTVWPDSLKDAVLSQQFRVPLGPGYSGPIVAGDLVFVTETVDKKTEVVRALNRLTGAEQWKSEWPGAMTVPFFAAANGSWIRSTPAWDGRTLYVAGMLDVLVALDGQSGKELWRTDFASTFGTGPEAFGFVCSPLFDNGFLYVQTAGGLVKVETATGAIVWRSLKEQGGMFGGAFSSPVIAELAGVRQLVVQTRSRLAGIDMESGNELWGVDIPSFRGMNILTPLVLDDRVFTSSYGGGSFMFQVSRAENRFTVAEVWKRNVEAYMSSPVVIDGQLYVHLRNQRFMCIDPATGEGRWTTRPFGRYWSMVVNDDRILVLDERGDLILIAADAAEYRQLDSRHVSDSSTWAHLAVSGNQIFVRELDALTVYRWQ